MNNLEHLNADDFKKWIKTHESDNAFERSNLVGMKVEAKFCGKKIARSIVLENGRAGRVVREFVQNGGLIKSVDGDEYLVEVESGSFYINRCNIII